jgi:hypothetical protein
VPEVFAEPLPRKIVSVLVLSASSRRKFYNARLADLADNASRRTVAL